MKRFLVPFVAGFLPAFVLMFSVQTGRADSATWKSNPESGEWWNFRNWTPETVPSGGSATATFATSNITSISISFGGDTIDGVVFDSGANAYQITLTSNLSSGPGRLEFFGAGITNNSGILQNFVNAPGRFYFPQIIFFNSATAGSLTVFTNKGPTSSRPQTGVIAFLDNWTAGDATFINKGSEVNNAPGGEIAIFLCGYWQRYTHAGHGFHGD